MYRNQGGENDGWVTDDLIRELAAEIAGPRRRPVFADAEREEVVAEVECAGRRQGRPGSGHADAPSAS